MRVPHALGRRGGGVAVDFYNRFFERLVGWETGLWGCGVGEQEEMLLMATCWVICEGKKDSGAG